MPECCTKISMQTAYMHYFRRTRSSVCYRIFVLQQDTEFKNMIQLTHRYTIKSPPTYSWSSQPTIQVCISDLRLFLSINGLFLIFTKPETSGYRHLTANYIFSISLHQRSTQDYTSTSRGFIHYSSDLG